MFEKGETENDTKSMADDRVAVYNTEITTAIANSYPDGKANRLYPCDHFKNRKAFKVPKDDGKSMQVSKNAAAKFGEPAKNTPNYEALFNDRSRKRPQQLNVFEKYG